MFWEFITPAQQQALKDAGEHRTVGDGDYLFMQGDAPNGALIIRTGRVKLVRGAPTGGKVLIELRSRGYMIGEMGVIDNEVRSLSIQAMGPVEYLFIPGPRFLELINQDQAILIAVLRSVTARLRETVNRRIEAATSTVTIQLGGRLLELAADQKPDADGSITLVAPLTQQELAEWIGASRDAVVGAFQRLREEDLVETGRRKIRIIKPQGLAEFVEPG